jgi:hypothetical protein
MAEDPKVAEKAPGFISDVPVVGSVVETLDDMGAGGVGLQEGARRAGKTSKGTGVQGFSTERAAEQLEQAGESIATGVDTLKGTLPGVVDGVVDFFVESEEERAERIAERNERFKRVAEREAKRAKKTETPKAEPVATSTEEISQIENEIAGLGDFPNSDVVKRLLAVAKIASEKGEDNAEKIISDSLTKIRSLIAQEKTNRENMNDVLNSLKSK